MKTLNFIRLMVAVFTLTLALAGCQSDSGSPNEGSGVTVTVAPEISYLLKQQLAAPPLSAFTASDVFTGTLQVTPTAGGPAQTFDWSVYVDEATFLAQSNKTIILDPGSYDFSLVVSKGDHRYAGEALAVDVGPVSDGENTISLTLSPVIGDVTGDVTVVARLVDLRFQYDPSELAVLDSPSIGITVDGSGTEQIFAVSPTSGLSAHMFLDLVPGPHNIVLRLFDSSGQRGKSLTAQEDPTLAPGVDVIMDLVALHAETQFSLDLAGGDATFNFTIPAEVVSEAGGLGELQARLLMTSAVTALTFDTALSLTSDGAGGATAQFVGSGLRFEDVTFELEFTDTGDSDSELLGSCLRTVTLTTSSQSATCDLTLRRRAAITGSLLATLGVNVFSTGLEPVGGAIVKANGAEVGISGSNPSFGTPGYVKLHMVAGTYTIRAEAGGLFGEATVTLPALGIDNVDVILDTPIPATGAGLDGTFGTTWQTLAGFPGIGILLGLQSFHYTGQPDLFDATHARRYSIASNSWGTMAPPPFGAAAWADAATEPTRLWVPRASNMYVYDIPTDTWSVAASGIPNGSAEATAAVFDGDGNIWYHVPGALVRFTPSTAAVATFAHSAFSTSETRVGYDPVTNSVVFAGFFGPTNFMRLDLDTLTFSLGAPSPGGFLKDNTCQDRSGNMYTGSSSGTAIWQYHVPSDSWALLPSPPVPHDNNSTCVVSQDGWLYYAANGNFFRLPLGTN